MNEASLGDSGQRLVRPPGFFALVFGVLLPLIALGVELTTRMNANVFFDPLPSVWHVIAVLLVPSANAWTWYAIHTRQIERLPYLSWANGVAIGIALFYAVLFLPLTPLGAIAIVYFGLGLLPFTPLFALLTAWRLRVHLARLNQGARLRPSWLPGVALGLLALMAFETPATVTRIGLRMATSNKADTRNLGLRWLRAIGDDELLLRLCYFRSGSATDMISFLVNLTGRDVTPDEARVVYYRVTGAPFNSLPAPVQLHGGRGFFGAGNFDAEQGGEEVGGRLRGLSLHDSRLDGSVDSDAALAYLEWTMTFKNTTPVMHEARAQIGLPSGAVVSRLTLWIDGEEREAAFAGRSAVRQAYQSIVRQRRDPALVTTAGADRISMQLFPVPANGEMKVRVGMTIPMTLDGERHGAFAMPELHQRNFEIAPELRHAVWIESKSPLRSTLADATRNNDAFALRAQVSDTLWRAPIRAETPAANNAWALDEREPSFIVRQSLRQQTVSAPNRLVIVLDGSAAMRESITDLAAIVSKLPPSIALDLIVAEDEPQAFLNVRDAQTLAEHITSAQLVGGRDNARALVRALDQVGKGDALLWLHGPQPVAIDSSETLLQRLERGAHPHWYELQVLPGDNLIAAKLDGIAHVQTVDMQALEALIGSWRSGAMQWRAERERMPFRKNADATDKTSQHLTRLWASDETARLIANKDRPSAISLAHRYQLVTPVSGAVVLETAQQYSGAGLQPVPPGTVPSIPEPETWALILVCITVLLYALRSRHGHVFAKT